MLANLPIIALLVAGVGFALFILISSLSAPSDLVRAQRAAARADGNR